MGNWRGVPDGTVRAFLHQRYQPWTKDAPIPKEQAMLEACLILVLNTHGFGERDLAERWGRSRNFVRAILKAAAEEMTSSEVPGWKVPKRSTGPTGHGSTTIDTNQDVVPSKGTKKVPEENQEGTKKVDRARSICREEESRSEQIPSSPKGVSPQEDKSEKQEGRHPEPEHGNTPTHPTRHESCEAARTQIPRPDFARAAEARGQYPAEPESGYASPYRPNLGEGTSPFFEGAGRPKPSRHRGINLTAVQDAPDMMGGVPCFRDVNHAARVTRKGTPEQVLMAQAWMFWRGTLDGEEVIVPEDARLLAEKYAPRWEAYDRRR